MCAKTRGKTIELQGRDRNEQWGDLQRVFLLVPDQQCERLLCLSRNMLRKSFSQLLLKRIFTARETRRSGSLDAGCRSGIKPEQGCASLGDGRRGERGSSSWGLTRLFLCKQEEFFFFFERNYQLTAGIYLEYDPRLFSMHQPMYLQLHWYSDTRADFHLLLR